MVCGVDGAGSTATDASPGVAIGLGWLVRKARGVWEISKLGDVSEERARTQQPLKAKKREFERLQGLLVIALLLVQFLTGGKQMSIS